LVVAGGDGGDQEQDRTHAGTSATNRSLAFSLATIVGDRGDTDELGNGLVVGADLRQFGHQAGDGAAGHALHCAPRFGEPRPQRIVINHGSNFALEPARLPLEQGDHLVDAG